MKKILFVDASASKELAASVKDLINSPGREVFYAVKESEVHQWLRNNKIDTVILEPVYPADYLLSEKEVDQSFLTGAGLVLYKNIIKLSKAKIILRTTQTLESLVEAGFPTDSKHIGKPGLISELIDMLEEA